MAAVRRDGRDLGNPLSAHQGGGRRRLGARAGLHQGRARLAAAAARGRPRRPPRRAEGARSLAGRVHPGGDRRTVRAALQRRTAPAQLHQRPAHRGGAHFQRAAGLADPRRRPADVDPLGRAGDRAGWRRPAGRPGRGPRGHAAGHRGAAHCARLLHRPADRQPQAGRPAAGCGQRGLPGRGRAPVRPVRRADLAALGAVGPGAGGPSRPRGGLHRGRLPDLLPADRGGRPGPRDRHHLRQPRRRGNARRPRPGRAPDPRHRRRVRPDPRRLHPGHPPRFGPEGQERAAASGARGGG